MILLQRLKRKFFHILEKFGYKPFSPTTPDTILELERAFKLTKNIKGDYYEFGVYKGYSFYKAHQFAKKYNNGYDMQFLVSILFRDYRRSLKIV
jgi:hypothetical protein